MRLRRRLAFAAAFLAASLASACAAQAADAVTVALGDVSLNKIPFMVAADQGIYAKYGLDVHQFTTPGAARAMAPSGIHVPGQYISDEKDAPITIGGGAPTIRRETSSPDAKIYVIVATMDPVFQFFLVTRPDSGIKTFRDLKGKRIGVCGAGCVPYYGLTAFAQKMGWNPKTDWTLDNADHENFTALKAHQVDAITAVNLIEGVAPDAGLTTVGNFVRFNLPLAGSGVMMESGWLKANRDVAARFIKATVEATALMKSDRKVFGATVSKYYGVTDPKALARMFKLTQVFPAKPYPSVEGVMGAMRAYDSPVMRQHKAEDFYDASFVADLDKSGFLDHPLADAR